jgi:hypothetical protein
MPSRIASDWIGMSATIACVAKPAPVIDVWHSAPAASLYAGGAA